MKYHLSNSQRKELLVRQRTLYLLLPHPPADGDLLQWARTMLDLPAEYITAAEELEVSVQMAHGLSGLTGFLGVITERPEILASNICHRVIAVEVILTPPVSRGTMAKWQWPGSVVIDGRRWPAEDTQ